jgi:hypothetical protein
MPFMDEEFTIPIVIFVSTLFTFLCVVVYSVVAVLLLIAALS